MTITGLVFIATVLWAPNGVLGLLKNRFERRRKSRKHRAETEKPDRM